MQQIRDAIETAIGITKSGFHAPPDEKSTWAAFGRALLWALGILAMILEIVVVAVTLTDSWNDHSAATAAVGNLLSGLALLAIGRVLYVNHRR